MRPTESDRAYWLAFSRLPGMNPRRALRLLSWFGDVEQAWLASTRELGHALGLGPETLAKLAEAKSNLCPAELLAQVTGNGRWLVSVTDAAYPIALRQLYDPPIVLYGWGAEVASQESRRLAVVGSRRMTAYGRQVTDNLLAELKPAEPVIISGLARGVDGEAHRSAMRHCLTTWAVLGSGLSTIYPAEHKALAAQIIEQGGTLLSEYWPTSQPRPYHFPARNRIIAALAHSLLVIEADERSGSLITVDHALDLGVDIFAVPGNITSRFSRGTNLLIQQGARLVSSATDILAEWGYTFEEGKKSALARPRLSGAERLLWEHLSGQPVSVELLVERSGLLTADVLAALTTLELKGLVTQYSGQLYALRQDN